MSPKELSELLKMPEPDTHCWDDDTQRDVWGYSEDQMRTYALAHHELAHMAERDRCLSICHDSDDCEEAIRRI